MNPVSLRRLAAAPHRAGFFTGALLLALAALWWLVALLLREWGSADSAFPASWLHGELMLTGFFPLFMLGFIYTAGPKWLGVAPPATRFWMMAIGLYALGSMLLIMASIYPFALIIAISMQLLGWCIACAIWLGRIRASQAPERRHAWLVWLSFLAGAVALLLYLLVAMTLSAQLQQAAQTLMLWGMLLPVYLIVSHRMLPFFTANVLMPYQPWRPDWLLLSWVGGCWLHAALVLAGLPAWPLDLGLGMVLIYTAWRWQCWRSLKVRLLAMQHLAFVWAGPGMLLVALAQWAPAMVSPLAGLHALALGFMVSMLLAFVTRVTLGHSGRPLLASRLVWCLFWAVQVLTVLRLLAEWWPQRRTALLLSAAGLLLACVLVWAWQHAPMYLQARPDGREG